MEKRRIILAIPIFVIAGMLLSCSESNITTDNSTQLTAGNINAVAAQKSHGDSPQKVFLEFQEMVKKLETMSKEEINSLSNEEILELGEPILKATENTIKLSKEVFKKLEKPLRALAESIGTITKAEHQSLSKEIEQIMASNGGRETRNLNVEDVRTLLMKFNDGGISTMSSICYDFFAGESGIVVLFPGDNFNLANTLCDAGSIFFIEVGTHTGQSVTNSKNGSYWIGISRTGSIMDGQNSTSKAFIGGMNNGRIAAFTIKRYVDHGIFSSLTEGGTDGIEIRNMNFKDIAPTRDGQEHGAIMFTYSEDIEVSNSYFENVASSIRIRHSDGPIEIIDNEALNSGRNFFQCGNCTGSGIRINGNSMDRTSSYGNAVLEDWISIFESEGTSGDWIQVNNNRARGHSSSAYGSFLILGDSGGKYQEAVGNIGVNPGQVGIGVAGGEYMLVEDNKMFSEQWASSNVAFYSADYSSPDPCSNHVFPASPNPNVAHWKNSSGNLNRAWADGNCGITVGQIRSNVDEDTSMVEDIWNAW